MPSADSDESINDDDHLGAHPEEAVVSRLFDEYEAALLRNDLDAMNAVFLESTDTLRIGIADIQFGFEEIVEWRRTAVPVDPLRTITNKIVSSIAPGVVAVDVTFVNGTALLLGRQSQTWVRVDEGWRIVRAHVSVIADA